MTHKLTAQSFIVLSALKLRDGRRHERYYDEYIWCFCIFVPMVLLVWGSPVAQGWWVVAVGGTSSSSVFTSLSRVARSRCSSPGIDPVMCFARLLSGGSWSLYSWLYDPFDYVVFGISVYYFCCAFITLVFWFVFSPWCLGLPSAPELPIHNKLELSVVHLPVSASILVAPGISGDSLGKASGEERKEDIIDVGTEIGSVHPSVEYLALSEGGSTFSGISGLEEITCTSSEYAAAVDEAASSFVEYSPLNGAVTSSAPYVAFSVLGEADCSTTDSIETAGENASACVEYSATNKLGMTAAVDPPLVKFADSALGDAACSPSEYEAALEEADSAAEYTEYVPLDPAPE